MCVDIGERGERGAEFTERIVYVETPILSVRGIMWCEVSKKDVIDDSCKRIDRRLVRA